MRGITSKQNKPVTESSGKNIFYNFSIKKTFKKLGLFLKDSVKSTKKMAASFANEVADIFEKDDIKMDKTPKVVYRRNVTASVKDNELLKPKENLFQQISLFLRKSLRSVKNFVTSIIKEVADIFEKDDIKMDKTPKVVYRKNVTNNIKSNELPSADSSVSSSPSSEEDLFLSGFQFKFNQPLKDSEDLYDDNRATDHIYEEITDLSKIVSMRYQQAEAKRHDESGHFTDSEDLYDDTRVADHIYEEINDLSKPVSMRDQQAEAKRHDESGHYDHLDHALSYSENQNKKITGLKRNEAKKCDGSGHYAHHGCSFFNSKLSTDVPPPLPPKQRHHILGKF